MATDFGILGFLPMAAQFGIGVYNAGSEMETAKDVNETIRRAVTSVVQTSARLKRHGVTPEQQKMLEEADRLVEIAQKMLARIARFSAKPGFWGRTKWHLLYKSQVTFDWQGFLIWQCRLISIDNWLCDSEKRIKNQMAAHSVPVADEDGFVHYVSALWMTEISTTAKARVDIQESQLFDEKNICEIITAMCV